MQRLKRRLADRVQRVHCNYHKQQPIIPRLIDGEWMLLWYRENVIKDLSTRDINKLLRDSLALIQPATRNIFFQQTDDIEKASLIFRFTNNHNRNMPEKFTPGVLALCHTQNGVGRIYLNSNVIWENTLGDKGAIARLSIAHQVGHCLGIEHEKQNTESLMSNQVNTTLPVLTHFVLESVESHYQQYWHSDAVQKKLTRLMKGYLTYVRDHPTMVQHLPLVWLQTICTEMDIPITYKNRDYDVMHFHRVALAEKLIELVAQFPDIDSLEIQI